MKRVTTTLIWRGRDLYAGMVYLGSVDPTNAETPAGRVWNIILHFYEAGTIRIVSVVGTVDDACAELEKRAFVALQGKDKL